MEIGNRTTCNVKIAVENASLWGENMQYVHFAEICKKSGNSSSRKTDMPNHIGQRSLQQQMPRLLTNMQ